MISTRKLELNDLDYLQEISKKTFFETFSENNTAENMDFYLNNAFSSSKLLSELNDTNSEFYFAVLDESIVGYLKLNFGESQIELKDKNSLEIERIYVLKEFQGKKIGQLLFNKAIEIAHSRIFDFIWLGVWKKNIKAIEFYKKNGFSEFDKHIFKFGDEDQIDIMMKKEL